MFSEYKVTQSAKHFSKLGTFAHIHEEVVWPDTTADVRLKKTRYPQH